MRGMHGRRLWAAGAAALGLWTSLAGAGAGAAAPVQGAGATAATPLGLVAQVGLSAGAAYPRALVVAYHDEAGTTLEVEVCETQESCAVHSASVRADALVDVGGEYDVVSLLADVEGIGLVRLRFASSGADPAASPVGCAGTRSGAVMQAGDGGRVEAGAVTGVIGVRPVRSTCSAAGRNAALAYALAPAPPAATV